MHSLPAQELAAQVIQQLTLRRETLATAESLTAGMCSAELASVPGASAVLRGGLVTYATDVKHTLAEVPQEVLERQGAVSKECAQYLAFGARAQLSSYWAIALTGVAGPDRQEGQPVGTVWCAIASVENNKVSEVLAEKWQLDSSLTRQEIRAAAVQGALALLLRQL